MMAARITSASVLLLVLVLTALASARSLSGRRGPLPPSSDAKAKARRVFDALESSPGVHEAAARTLFAALRAGQDPQRSRVQGLYDDIRAAEANSTELHEVGDALLQQLRGALRNPRPGLMDDFTGYIFQEQHTRLCMPQIWWQLAKQQLQSSTSVRDDELRAFRQVVNYVQTCQPQRRPLPSTQTPRNIDSRL